MRNGPDGPPTERRKSSRSRSRPSPLSRITTPPKVLLSIALTCIAMVLIIVYIIRLSG